MLVKKNNNFKAGSVNSCEVRSSWMNISKYLMNCLCSILWAPLHLMVAWHIPDVHWERFALYRLAQSEGDAAIKTNNKKKILSWCAINCDWLHQFTFSIVPFYSLCYPAHQSITSIAKARNTAFFLQKFQHFCGFEIPANAVCLLNRND